MTLNLNNLNILDRVGDWNPQLFRELKGKLKPRNMAIAIVLSLLGQGLLLLFCSGSLPNLQAYQESITSSSKYLYTNAFCLGENTDYGYYACQLDTVTNSLIINWSAWWLQIFRSLNWGLPSLLTVGGAFLLAQDMSKEESRGTLNFIRLSPQSAQDILIGKLLGVPSLVYLLILSTIPLHIWSSIQAHVSSAFIASFYGIVGLGCGIFYMLNLLTASLGQKSAGQSQVSSASLIPLVLGFVFVPLFLFWNITTSWSSTSNYLLWNRPENYDLRWFALPLSKNAWLSNGFNLVNLGLIAHWSWGSIVRRFNQPNSTIANKKHSYFITAYLEILVLGFSIALGSGNFYNGLISLLSFNLVYFLILIAALSPHRQDLLDWARYRHMASRENRKGSKSDIQDLIWSEKSPAPVAVAVNLAIALGIFLLGTIFTYQGHNFITQVLLFASLISIYAVVTQILLMMRTNRRAMWAGAILCGMVLLPPSILGILSVKTPFLWLFSSFSWIMIGAASFTDIFMAFSIQLVVLTFLSLHLKRKLQKAGESEFKALLHSQSS